MSSLRLSVSASRAFNEGQQMKLDLPAGVDVEIKAFGK
jgi:hypothetical protein